MAVLQINGDWRINTDRCNWILQERTVSKDGKENWNNEGYYPSLPATLKSLADQAIKIPDNIQDIAAKLDELYKLIDRRISADIPLAAFETQTVLEEVESETDCDNDEDLDFLS